MKLKNRKSTEKLEETKSCFFEKINELDKPLDKLTKEKKERRHKLLIIRNETTINLMKIKRTMKEYYEQLYAHKIDNLDGPIPRKTQSAKTHKEKQMI